MSVVMEAERRKRRRARLMLGASVVALAILTSLLANLLNGEVLFARWWGAEAKLGDSRGLWLGELALLLAATWVFARYLINHAPALLPVHSVEPDDHPPPCQGVMLFLSLPAKGSALVWRDNALGGFVYTDPGYEELLLPASGSAPAMDLYIDLIEQWQKKTNGKWNCLPLLRALHPHLRENSLRQVCLLCSPEVIRHEGHAPAVKSMLCAATGLNLDRIEIAPTIDIQDFDGAYRTMAAVLEQWAKQGIPPRLSMIDITGSSRPGPIAGAMLTLDRDVTFQHLVQKPPFDKIVAYRKRYDAQQKPAGL